MLESSHQENANKHPKHMFCEETRTKQCLSYISFCALNILYNSKFILMATSLGTNAVILTRVPCNNFYISEVMVAEWLVLPILDHKVPGSNPTGDGIQVMTVACYCTVFHYNPPIMLM